MSSASIELEVQGGCVKARAEYTLTGGYYPETPTSPEEWPEMEITKLELASGLDITELLEDNNISNNVSEAIYESIEL